MWYFVLYLKHVLKQELTFRIASSRHQVVQTTMIATDLILSARFARRYQIPDEVLDLFVAFVYLQAVEKLKKKIKCTH